MGGDGYIFFFINNWLLGCRSMESVDFIVAYEDANMVIGKTLQGTSVVKLAVKRCWL